MPWRDLVSTVDLLNPSLPNQSFGGYRHGEVNDLLERAAASIDHLQSAVESLESELRQAQGSQRAYQDVVSQVLMTAQRVVEVTKEDARHAASELIAQAQAEADRAGQLRLEAQAVLDGARVEAETARAETQPKVAAALRAAHTEAEAVTTAARAQAEEIVSAARTEAEMMTASARNDAESMTAAATAQRQQLIASSTHDAEEARAALEAEAKRIDGAIEDLRRTWTERLGRALERLDAGDSSPAIDANGDAGPMSTGTAIADLADDDRPVDLASELHGRLGSPENGQAAPAGEAVQQH